MRELKKFYQISEAQKYIRQLEKRREHQKPNLFIDVDMFSRQYVVFDMEGSE